MIIEKSTLSLFPEKNRKEIKYSYKETQEIILPKQESHTQINVSGFPAFIDLPLKNDIEKPSEINFGMTINTISMTLLSDLDPKVLNEIDNKSLQELDIKNNELIKNIT